MSMTYSGSPTVDRTAMFHLFERAGALAGAKAAQAEEAGARVVWPAKIVIDQHGRPMGVELVVVPKAVTEFTRIDMIATSTTLDGELISFSNNVGVK